MTIFGTRREAFECRCDCHTNKNVKHCMPCCERCPHCKKNFKSLALHDCKKVKP